MDLRSHNILDMACYMVEYQLLISVFEILFLQKSNFSYKPYLNVKFEVAF